MARVCLASCSFSQEEPGFLPWEVPSPDAKRGGRPTLLPPRKPFKPCENLGPGPRQGVQCVARVGGGELGPRAPWSVVLRLGQDKVRAPASCQRLREIASFPALGGGRGCETEKGEGRDSPLHEQRAETVTSRDAPIWGVKVSASPRGGGSEQVVATTTVVSADSCRLAWRWM